MELPHSTNYTLPPSIPVLYQDEFLLVINKPAGILSVPGGFSPDIPCVQQLLMREYGRLWIIHRLDKDTSGSMILARNAEIHRTMNLYFDSRKIKKDYLAIILGSPEWDSVECAQPLKVNADRAHRTRVHAGGKPATTHFAVIERFGCSLTLIKASPATGLTHQIRAHLGDLGYPIFHDWLYVDSEQKMQMENCPIKTDIRRMALHASQISFPHPVTSAPTTVYAPLPNDLQDLINEMQG